MAMPTDDRDDEADDLPRPKRRRPAEDEADDYDDGRRDDLKPTTGFALTAMITGIVALPLTCLCGPFNPLSLCGIIFGFLGMKQNKSMALTGVICGFVSLALGIILIIARIGMQANMQNGQNPFAR